MQTMQQKRAKYALDKVEEVKEKDSKDLNQKEYKSYAQNFPAMIRMNGLGQAAAYYLSKGSGEKGNPAYNALYELLSDWMKKPGQPYAGLDNLMIGITTKDMHHYRQAQAEALLLLDWIKKFAKAFIEEEKKNEPAKSAAL